MGNLFSSDFQLDFAKADDLRKEAREYGSKRAECVRMSQEAYRSRNHKDAKAYKEKGQQYQKLMQQANKRASDAIFNHLNKPGKIPKNSIDFHLLFVNEAIERLEKRIIKCKKKNATELIVIVGKGNHSSDGPKIKPAVIEFVEQRKLRYQADTPNPGCIRIEFDQTNIVMRFVYFWRNLLNC